jgi:hypothetical protein
MVAAVLIAFTVAGTFGASSLWADEQADRFLVSSVWPGMMEQLNPKSSYPVVLFVKQRKGDAFEGATWYPTLGNGLLKVTGRIDTRGKVTFTEDEVIHAELLGDGLIHVVAGSKFTAKLEKTLLTGSGKITEFTDPNTKKTISLKEASRLTFSLKLAE